MSFDYDFQKEKSKETRRPSQYHHIANDKGTRDDFHFPTSKLGALVCCGRISQQRKTSLRSGKAAEIVDTVLVSSSCY